MKTDRLNEFLQWLDDENKVDYGVIYRLRELIPEFIKYLSEEDDE